MSSPESRSTRLMNHFAKVAALCFCAMELALRIAPNQ